MKRILQGKMCWKTYCFYFIRQEENIKSNEHIFHSSKIFKYFSQNPSTFQGLEGGISFSSTFKHFFSFSRIRTHPVPVYDENYYWPGALHIQIPPDPLSRSHSDTVPLGLLQVGSTVEGTFRIRCSYCDSNTVHAVAAAYPQQYQYSNLQ